MARSDACVRGLLLLVFIQGFSSLPFISSAAPTRQSDIVIPSLEGSADLRAGPGFPTIFPLGARDVNPSRSLTERRRRSLLGAARMSLGDDLLSKGYYTSKVLIGSPEREFALIVDTGSTVTYVPCSSCTHCGNHQDLAFKPENSTTYEAISCISPSCNTGVCDNNKQCKYERRYAESSTSAGVLGKDQFGFGDNSDLGSPKLVFGCENAETGDLFYQRADGIMGLGRGQLSIVDQLVKERDMADTFSLCYGGMDQQGGSMIMGEYTRPPGMVFTASDPHRSPYYNIVLKKIKVAGTALPVDAKVFDGLYGTVLDSGTTYAYLPEKAFNEFKRAILDQLKLKSVAGPDPQFDDFCFQGAGSDPKKLSDHFPAVELEFGDGVSLALEPENYLFKHTQVSGAYCLGVFKNDNDHTTLLGGILVRDTLVEYDRGNKQIGFWRTNCTELWTSLQDAYNGKSPPIESSPTPKNEFKNPPTGQPIAAPAPIQIPDDDIGSLELNISVAANYTSFNSLSPAFVEDMARDFELEPHQVKVVDFHKNGSGVDVTCAVSPVSVESPLHGSTVQNIIVRLQQHRVEFRSDVGNYHLNNWRVIPEERSSWAEKNAGLVLGMVILTVVLLSGGVALWFYRRSRDRTRNVKYVTVDALGDSASQQL